jgi:methionine salvage enolase-phosphatase E1
MTGLWLVTGLALAVAALAWMKARRTMRRLEQLSEMYWELKYQHGELRAHVQRGAGAVQSPQTSAANSPNPSRPTEVFVPLTSLRR